MTEYRPRLGEHGCSSLIRVGANWPTWLSLLRLPARHSFQLRTALRQVCCGGADNGMHRYSRQFELHTR